jgi:hypothetical protein
MADSIPQVLSLTSECQIASCCTIQSTVEACFGVVLYVYVFLKKELDRDVSLASTSDRYLHTDIKPSVRTELEEWPESHNGLIGNDKDFWSN